MVLASSHKVLSLPADDIPAIIAAANIPIERDRDVMAIMGIPNNCGRFGTPELIAFLAWLWFRSSLRPDHSMGNF